MLADEKYSSAQRKGTSENSGMIPEISKNQGERNKKPLIIDRKRKIIAFMILHTFVFFE